MFDQQFTASGMADHCRARKETISPGMIGVIMGVDHVTHLHTQLVLDELAHPERFFGQGQCIDHHRPLRTNDHASRNLRIDFTLEPKNIFRHSFTMHTTTLFHGFIFIINSTLPP